MAAKKGLGKGLDSLIPSKPIESAKEVSDQNAVENAKAMVSIDKIEPNAEQPRKAFDEDALMELADSIKQHGVLSPLWVHEVKNGKDSYYEIIAGERRWRAAKKAGLKEVPVIVMNLSEQEIVEISLIENIQREDLNPIEEAESYQRLQEEFQLSQEKIAEKVGKSRSAITNSLRLLQLDARVRNFVTENKLTGGHARSLLPVSDGDAQFELAEHIIEEGLSVRAVEALVKAYLAKEDVPAPAEKAGKADETAYRAIEEDLKSLFATKVNLKPIGKRKKGKIEIEYYSEEDLERLLVLLKR